MLKWEFPTSALLNPVTSDRLDGPSGVLLVASSSQIISHRCSRPNSSSSLHKVISSTKCLPDLSRWGCLPLPQLTQSSWQLPLPFLSPHQPTTWVVATSNRQRAVWDAQAASCSQQAWHKALLATFQLPRPRIVTSLGAKSSPPSCLKSSRERGSRMNRPTRLVDPLRRGSDHRAFDNSFEVISNL